MLKLTNYSEKALFGNYAENSELCARIRTIQQSLIFSIGRLRNITKMSYCSIFARQQPVLLEIAAIVLVYNVPLLPAFMSSLKRLYGSHSFAQVQSECIAWVSPSSDCVYNLIYSLHIECVALLADSVSFIINDVHLLPVSTVRLYGAIVDHSVNGFLRQQLIFIMSPVAKDGSLSHTHKHRP